MGRCAECRSVRGRQFAWVSRRKFANGRLGVGSLSPVPKDKGRFFGEVQIGATKQSCCPEAFLRHAFNQTGCFEIVQASIERAHRLHGASGQKLTTGEYGGVRPIGVDSACKCGQHGASSSRERWEIRSTMRGPEYNPREI